MARRLPRQPSLGLSGRAAPPHTILATIDGAARGNPGPAAYGVLFEDARGNVLARLAGRVGRATNNVAEYRALLAALAYARAQGWRALRVRTDSELLARQLQGLYRVRSSELKPLHEEAWQLIPSLDYFAVEIVPRKLTRPADKLANAALDGPAAPGGKGLAGSRFKPKEMAGRGAEFTPSISEGHRQRQAGSGKVVRALFEQGVLRPLDHLDLTEGEEVELTLRRRP